jgi:type II secretory pathway component GspD/PulD (secretin)
MTRDALKVAAVVMTAVLLTACAATMAFKRGEDAARKGDWDAAVVHYREAVQGDPDNAEYKIGLERAMLQAAGVHAFAAKRAEAQGDLDTALREARRASEYDPTNRQIAAKVVQLEQTIRDRIEASRPKPPVEKMRERARALGAEPVLNPASREPLKLSFVNASVRDILNFIGEYSGINITFSSDYREPAGYTVRLSGVTLEEALRQVLSSNNLFYKVLNERTILVIPDTPQNRAKYEEQVVRTFYLSNADAVEVAQLLNTVLRVPGVAIIPTIAPNKTRNTITVRGTRALVEIMERVVEANDRPSAEVLLDVSIMEVNRTRAKQYGIDLSAYNITGIFSPEVAPTVTAGTGGNPSTITVPPFNANIISAGISAADFYLAVPQAIARFLESDTRTKLVAKPQLRGQEGQKITLNLGDEIPVPQTTFGSAGGVGSIATVPISQFNYKNVGVNVIMTPRVTFDGDIVLELSVESSTLGADVNVAGQNLPSFGSRKVETKIRLRDGESTLLAGLLREDERRALKGVIGLMHVPGLSSLFSSNDNTFGQTDIVMLITPHIVRTHELRQQDVDPIYIGTQQNLGLGGPPPLIGEEAPPAPAAGAGAAPRLPNAGARETAPSSSQPVPGIPGSITPPAYPTPQPGAIPGTLTSPGMVPPLPPPEPQTPTQPQTPQQQQTPPQSPNQPPQATPGATPQGEGTPPPQGQRTAPGEAQPQAEQQGETGNVAAVVVTPPGTELRVGGGPYTVPISMSNAPRLSTLSVTVTFNPSLVHVRSVQEGSFMRQGGVSASFSQQVDAAAGRVDITFSRSQDIVGASGTGLIAALVVEPIAPGSLVLAASGAATGPAGANVAVQSAPVTVTIR